MESPLCKKLLHSIALFVLALVLLDKDSYKTRMDGFHGGRVGGKKQ